MLRALLERLTGPRPPAAAAAATAVPGPQGLDLLDPAFVRDPYPFYAWLRANDPVHRTRQGAWLLTRHADVAAALSNPDLGNAPSRQAAVHERNAARHASADVARNILPFLDKPRHIRPRRIVGSVFRAALRDRPPDVEALAMARLGELGASFDAIGDYAEPVSIRVICDMIGLPDDDARLLAAWAGHFFALFAPMPSEAVRQATDRGLEEFRAYLRETVRARRAAPRDDIVSRMLSASDDEGRLTEQEVVDNCMLLFADGVENIDRGFGNLLLALHRHPDETGKLRMSPGLAAAAAEEMLRYDPPGQTIARVARADIELGGRAVRRDGAVLLGLAAANRDPDAFADPDRFDLSRAADDGHSTFGRGRHSCIGAALARIELTGLLASLIRHARHIEVQDGALAWESRLAHRWLKALPVRIAR